MKRTIAITYEWKRSGNKKIKPTHIEALEETAERIIFDRLSEGYQEGELQDYIHMNATDGPDGTEYNGWFKIEKTP